MANAEAEQLRRRRLELGERLAAELDLHALGRRHDSTDLVTDEHRLVERRVRRHLELGVRDPAPSTPSDAICRSLPGAYGLSSDCTPSILATSAKNGSITARTPGSSTPLFASNTMLPTWPAPCPPNWSSKISMPRLLSTSGSVKSER